MAEKSQLKEYICKANISLKDESGVAYVKDQFYTAEEVRRAPKDKKHKFAKLETIDPGKIDGTEQELKQLIQNQQLQIQTLKAVVAQYENPREATETQGAAITSKTGGQKPGQKL